MHTSYRSISSIAAAVAGLGLVALSLAPMVSAQTTVTTTTVSTVFTRDLTIGSVGADVTALQKGLISKGYIIPAGPTGYFGFQTQSALAQYQAANGIVPAAGYFGPITRSHIASSMNIPPIGISKEMADDAINDAKNAIEDAEDVIEDADDDGDDLNDAEDLLDDAENELDEAEDRFDDRDYASARAQAINAEAWANRAVDEIDEDDDEDANRAADAIDDAQDEINDAEDRIEEAQNDDEDTDEAEDLLNEAEDLLSEADEAFDDEDYNDAEELAEDSKERAQDAIDELDDSDDDDDDTEGSDVQTSANTTIVDGANNDYATFKITLDLETFDQDAYIDTSPAVSFDYEIQDEDGNAVVAQTTLIASLDSGADDDDGYYIIDENSEEEFTLNVVFNPRPIDEPGFFSLRLLGINYNDTPNSPDQELTFRSNKYETKQTYINN